MRYCLLAASLSILAASTAGADVLASVDDATLTWEQLLAMVGGEENSQYLAVGSEAEAEEMLRSWVREELVVRAAQSDGLESRPEIAYAIDQAVRQILLEAYLGEMTADVSLSRLTIENYVTAWRESFRTDIHARHILLPDLAQAQAALARLQSGESFDVLAQELSIWRGSRVAQPRTGRTGVRRGRLFSHAGLHERHSPDVHGLPHHQAARDQAEDTGSHGRGDLPARRRRAAHGRPGDCHNGGSRLAGDPSLGQRLPRETA